MLSIEFVAAGFTAEASLGIDVHKQCGPAAHEARTLFFSANEAVFPDGFVGGICIFFDVLHRAFPLIEIYIILCRSCETDSNSLFC